MSKLSGQMFKLYAEISGTYTLIAAMRSTSLTLNNESIDVTDKDNSLWKTLLESAGIQSISIKSSGICNNSPSFAFIRLSAITGAFINIRLESSIKETFEGVFKITSMESSGEYNKEEIISITLDSNDEVIRSLINFRLLEDGSYRLLESGDYRLLEAA